MTGNLLPSDSPRNLPPKLDIDFALRAAGLGVWEIDPATSLIRWDEQCRALFGLTEDDQRTHEQVLQYVHPDDVERVREATRWAMNPASDGLYDQTFRTLGADDGQLRFVRFVGKVSVDAAGQPARFAGAARDVTQQIRDRGLLEASEARQRLLLSLSDRLRPLNDSAQIQYQAATLLGQYLQADRVGFAEDQRDGQTIEVTQNYRQDVPTLERRYSYDTYGPALSRAFRAGQTVVRSDIAHDDSLTPEEKEAHAALFLGATLNIPLLRKNQLVLVLFVHYRAGHDWTPAEISLCREVADRTWLAVERARAEEALRQSEDKYRTLFNSIDEGFCIVEVILDEHGKPFDLLHLEANQAYELYTGLSNIVGKRSREIIPEGGPWLDFYGHVALTGQAARNESYLAAPVNRWIAAYASRVGGEGSLRVAIVFNDITERKRQERQGELLARIAQELIQLDTIEQTLERLGETISRFFEVPWCLFAELVPGPEDTLAVTASGWNAPGVPSLNGTYRMEDYLSAEQLTRHNAGEISVVADTQTNPAVDGENYGALGIRAFINVPLAREGRWQFQLAILSDLVRPWAPHEIDLIQVIAHQIWARLERVWAERALRESQTRLASLRPLTLLGQTEALAQIGSWDYDRASTQFTWSAGMYRLFDEAVGQPIRPEIYLARAAEGEGENARRLVDYFYQGQGPFATDLRVRVGEQIKTLRIKAQVIGESGQQRVLGVDLDLSEQLAAQQQIRQTAYYLQAVLDGSPASIGLFKAVHDPTRPEHIVDFQLAVSNNKLAEFIGQPLSQLQNRSATEFARLLWGGDTLAGLRHIYQSHGYRYEEKNVPTAGKDRWLAISVMRQDDGIVFTGLDITALKQMQAQQQQWLLDLDTSRQSVEALAQLKASLAQRTDTLRAVSHDLRGNFGIITGALQLLDGADSEGERATMLAMVMRNVRQATSLLTDLLDVARLESGQQQRTLTAFDASELLQELGQSLQPVAQEQGLVLRLSGPPTLPVENDRKLVFRLAQNLLINALKYTRQGHVVLE